MADLKELMEKRQAVRNRLHAYQDENSKEWTPEDDAAWNKMHAEYNRFTDLIKQEKALETAENLENAGTDGANLLKIGNAGPKQMPKVKFRCRDRHAYEEIEITDERFGKYKQAFRQWMKSGPHAMTADELGSLKATLTSGDDERAGFFVPDEEFAAGVYRAADDVAYMRQWATVFTVRQADRMTWRRRTSKTSTWAWGTELQEPTADTSLKFGTRSLEPHYLTGEISTSRDLVRRSVLGIEQLVTDEIRSELSDVLEDVYLFGSGAGRPTGIFTPNATNGISTARDVSTHNTTTVIAADHLRAVKYSLREVERRTARWLLHREIIEVVSKLKDLNDQYLWTPGLRDGDPDQLLGHAVFESEFAPKTQTAGLYVGMFGNFAKYYIADSLDMEVQRLDEISARQNQIVWIFRLKTDGMVIDENAFTRMQMAAS